ncbi:hypothetical protein HNY73_016960 [Argiope bruennichi]|uniref:Uncharacterized protein n=1 Tax=Argiope bruennichi TaxID=94029 RepID=A0A8T0EKI7_ARGBR|nr:hypothetical protein HNY73_016960 [Argiope bruennichi]
MWLFLICSSGPLSSNNSTQMDRPLCAQQISIKRNYIHFTEAVRALAPVGSFSPQLAMPPFRKAVTAPPGITFSRLPPVEGFTVELAPGKCGLPRFNGMVKTCARKHKSLK